jgi:hypothetical protein
MAECKKEIVSGKDVNEFLGSFGEFKGLLKPGMPPFKGLDNKDALSKWLQTQFWIGILAHTINFVLIMLNTTKMAIGGLIGGIIGAFIGAWFSWFMLIKREPNCCCIFVFVITGWKQMYLVYGLLMMFYGAYNILMAVLGLLDALNPAAGPTALIYNAISVAVMSLYAITWFFIGLTATKMGAKMAGVELPEAVGKAGA